MSLARNITTVGSATLLSRLLGFFRDMGIAALFGAGPLADAYLAALQIPNLFRRLLAEGALNAAFVPVWLRKQDEAGPAAARRFAEEVLGMVLLALGAIAILCAIFAPNVVDLIAPGFEPADERHALAVNYVRLSIAYIGIAGMVAVCASVLNAEARFGAVAFGVVAFNTVSLVIVLVLIGSGMAASPQMGAILSVGVVLSGIGQLVVIGAALLTLQHAPILPRFAPSAEMARFFALALPGLLAAGVPQLKLLAGIMIASSSQSAVSWLYYANRLYELPLGIVSIAIASVLVPVIAKSVREKRSEAFAAAQSRAFEIALGLALPAATALVILAEPIARTLFERGAFEPSDTVAVALALAAVSSGLPGHALEKVFGAICFAHEDTRTPMFAALAGLATAIAGALMLFPHFGHVGVAAAIAISGWVGALALAAILSRRNWLGIDPAAIRRLPRILLATIVMGIAILAFRHFLASIPALNSSTLGRATMLAVMVLGGLTTYLLLLQALGIAQLRQLAAMIRNPH